MQRSDRRNMHITMSITATEEQMKQVFQSLKDGSVTVQEVPVPNVPPHHLLVENHVSLISAGTERMLAQFGASGWAGKARQHPDKVKAVLDKARTDGVVATFEAVQSKLQAPISPGYSAVGRARKVGRHVQGFAPGTRVVSNGPHAEVVAVPQTLCAVVPENVDDLSASFTVVGAVALQGVRLAKPTLGETIAVIGLGLIGLLTVQILKAQGCRVIGFDLDPDRCKIAEQFGAKAVALNNGADPVDVARSFAKHDGVDAVLLTVSTDANDPVHHAAQMCRQRGRIVLVGVSGLTLNRADFYDKELTFQVSRSYGPGRYDPTYERRGQDYPLGHVRWTAQRNFEAFLELLAEGKVNVAPLVSHQFDISAAADAFAVLTSRAPSIGIMLRHGAQPVDVQQKTIRLPRREPPLIAACDAPRVSFLGAGNHAQRVLLPVFAQAGAEMRAIASGTGASAVTEGNRFGFQVASTQPEAVCTDSETDAVVISTRHNQHASQVRRALMAGKHVFCEKPLCLTHADLDEIDSCVGNQILMVGFNRRFSPLVRKMSDLLADVSTPKAIMITVNAGQIPAEHWVQDPKIGGGRIVGEACHFIDLARHLVGQPITDVSAQALGHTTSRQVRDSGVINLGFRDGSIATIHYLANGHRRVSKERIEVFADGRTLRLDNFRSLRGWGWRRFRRQKLWRQNKGHADCVSAFVQALRGQSSGIIPLHEIIEVSRAAITAHNLVVGDTLKRDLAA